MRARKRVLVACVAQVDAEWLKFLLELRGPYAVTVVAGAADALQVLDGAQHCGQRFDLLLASLGWTEESNLMALEAKRVHEGLKVVIFSHTSCSYERACHADVFLPKARCSPVEMLECVRIATARKRGPMKWAVGTVREGPRRREGVKLTAKGGGNWG
jgi:CheY-like chemotaxis protein